MRIWDLKPSYLCKSHLLAEHGELHAIWNILIQNKKGYSKHPEVLRWKGKLAALYNRHESEARELNRRGYKHRSLLDKKLAKGDEFQNILLNSLEEQKTILRRKKCNCGRYFSKSFNYSLNYSEIDFRQNPHLYQIGKGEQGVLLVEPYKSEMLPYWRFKTPEIAKKSATKIYSLFLNYKKSNDFVGMDMARKFLQMGYTRSRRYANHKQGKKYDEKGNVLPQDIDSGKARSARIFYKYYQKVKTDIKYQELKKLYSK